MKSSISVSQLGTIYNSSSIGLEQKQHPQHEHQNEPQLIQFEDVQLDVAQQERHCSISPSSQLTNHINQLKKTKINQYLEKAKSKYMKESQTLKTVFRKQTVSKPLEVSNTELLKQELHNIEHQTLYHREIQKFMIAFSINPQKSIQEQINNGNLKDNPEAIAQYLVEKEAINKDMLGEYFGEENPKVLQVLKHYCRLLNFRNLQFDKALRLLLSKFKIPGQAQKIQRIVWKFAQVYYESHSHEFKQASQIHILSYALIMLNSDAHNPNQQNKMTLVQFVKNTSPVCPGISKKYLQAMYDRIVNEKFQTVVNYIQKIYNRLHMLNLNVSVAGLSKILSNVMELMKGHIFIKFCQAKVKSVQRRVYLSEDQKQIRWVDAVDKIQRHRSIKIQDIKDLVLGCSTQVMKTNKVPLQFDSMCFSIITSKRSLDLKARDSKTRAKWANYIGALLIQKRQNRKIKEQTEFNLHFSKQKIEDKWNTEIFTKWDQYWDYKLKRPKVLRYEIVHNIFQGFCCGSTNKKVYEIQKDKSNFFLSNGQLLSTLWKFGLPGNSRKTLWPIVIGNPLGFTPALYQIYKKKKRILPDIQKLPYSHECVQLVQILAVIRPDINLVRNLLEVAQIFTRYLSKYDAFCSFVNTMHGYHFLPFFQGEMNQIQSRILFFQYLLEKNLPFVSMHFRALQINTKVYFVNWFLSVFSHCFPQQFLGRIWDNFLLQGEIYLFKIGLALVKYYEFELKMSTFDEVMKLLTRPKDTSQVLFFKILDDEISINEDEFDDYIQKRKYAFIKTKVQQIPLQ